MDEEFFANERINKKHAIVILVHLEASLASWTLWFITHPYCSVDFKGPFAAAASYLPSPQV